MYTPIKKRDELTQGKSLLRRTDLGRNLIWEKITWGEQN